MELKNFLKVFREFPQIDQTAKVLSRPNSHIHWKGHVGSSRSISAIAVAEQTPGHHVFILNDKEEAAYFLNDLEGIYPEDKRILFYPSSCQVPYQFEETDNANVVHRAEILERVASGFNTWIVTYPEALFEKVPTKKKLLDNTLRLEVGKNYSIDFINELLLEYHFDRVDFVYEPGQFSIRGGLVDVFSYANDSPFRIEFFGDEIETIRTFDAATQLSLKSHSFFNVIPNIQGQISLEGIGSFFEFIGQSAILWLSSHERLAQIISREYAKAEAIFDKLGDTVKHTIPANRYLNESELKQRLENYKTIEWGSDFYFKTEDLIHFDFTPQPNFNKNFDLLKTDLLSRQENNFENLIFSNQPRQIERLFQIFEDIGGEVSFSPMHLALQEGFISPSMKLVCYTDHQIFERYHRFRLKEGFRQAKQALTLKEIYNLQKGDYITHIDHGVGQFSGLETIDVNGKPQEAIRLNVSDPVGALCLSRAPPAGRGAIYLALLTITRARQSHAPTLRCS